jgi:hypothetical protein
VQPGRRREDHVQRPRARLPHLEPRETHREGRVSGVMSTGHGAVAARIIATATA